MIATALAPTEAGLAEEFGKELDRIRSEAIATRGADDAWFIRTVIVTQRGCRPPELSRDIDGES